MNNKELINISIKALNKNNEDKIEYEDFKQPVLLRIAATVG